MEFVRQLRREKPEAVMIANAPVPMLVLAALYLAVFKVRWVLWHQDVQAVAIRSFAGDKLPPRWRLAARPIEFGERWASRRADHVGEHCLLLHRLQHAQGQPDAVRSRDAPDQEAQAAQVALSPCSPTSDSTTPTSARSRALSSRSTPRRGSST